MCIAVLFTIARIWKQPKCPSVHEWIKMSHTMGYYLHIKNEILPFTTPWIDLSGIMTREISQKEKAKYHMISLTCGILNDKVRQRTDWWLQRRGEGEWVEGVKRY